MFLRAWAVNDTYSEILLVVFPSDCTSPNLLSRKSYRQFTDFKTFIPQVSWKSSDLSVVMNTSTMRTDRKGYTC
jgi:hypothetical protein